MTFARSLLGFTWFCVNVLFMYLGLSVAYVHDTWPHLILGCILFWTPVIGWVLTGWLLHDTE